jgi:hypothetical protein
MVSMNESPSALAKVPSGVDQVLAWYGRQTWLRAVVQGVPYAGGTLDTLLAWRGTSLAQERFEQFVASVSARVEHLESASERDQLLESEEFFELFATTVEAVVGSASSEKRARAAAFMAGTIRDAHLHDLSQQIADDLVALRDLHLRILASLPEDPRYGFLSDARGATHLDMQPDVYAKGLSDLARFGFIKLNTDSTGTFDSGPPEWETTEYLTVFRRAIQDGPAPG